MLKKIMAEIFPNLMKIIYLRLKQVLHLKTVSVYTQTMIKMLVVQVAHYAEIQSNLVLGGSTTPDFAWKTKVVVGISFWYHRPCLVL